MNTTLLGLMIAGALLVLLALPLVLRTVKPNRVYGIRTTLTLANADVWYDVNAYGGKVLALLGVLVCTVGACGQYVYRGDLREFANAAMPVTILCLVITFAAIRRRSRRYCGLRVPHSERQPKAE